LAFFPNKPLAVLCGSSLLLLLLLLKSYLLPTQLPAGTDWNYRVKKSGITMKQRGTKVNVKMASLQTTLKTVFGGSQMDVFGEGIPDGRVQQRRLLSHRTSSLFSVQYS